MTHFNVCKELDEIRKGFLVFAEQIDKLSVSIVKNVPRELPLKCTGCESLRGNSCILGPTNHCKRRAEDFYKEVK